MYLKYKKKNKGRYYLNYNTILLYDTAVYKKKIIYYSNISAYIYICRNKRSVPYIYDTNNW